MLHSSSIAEHIRENRQLFLHKGCWHKFKGYAYGQLNKMRSKEPIGKRKELIEKYGYDVKFAYHVVRLLNEVEQLLTEQDLDLMRNAEQLKAIRNGDWSQAALEDYFSRKEPHLESLYQASSLPDMPNTDAVRQLLVDCLEQHYGSLDAAVTKMDKSSRALADIRKILDGYES